MKSACASLPYRYFDTNELADILGLSLRTITMRAKHRPWLLPPRAELFDRELLRWRQDIVEAWLTNADDLKCLHTRPSAPRSDGS
jgi:hypothetical protein